MSDELVPATDGPCDIDSPDALRTRVIALKRRSDEVNMQLARDLWVIYHRGHYKDWNYESFDDYVTAEVGISTDRAHRLRRLWTKLVIDVGVAPDDLRGVGYSAALLIARVAKRGSAQQWIEDARNLKTPALQAKIERSLPKPDIRPLPDSEAIPATLPRSPTVEAPATPPPPPLVKRVYYLHAEQAKVLDEAIAESERFGGSNKDGHNLSQIALHFLATRAMDGNTPQVWLPFFLRHLERGYGGKIFQVKSAEGLPALTEFLKSRPDLFTTSEPQNGQAVDE